MGSPVPPNPPTPPTTPPPPPMSGTNRLQSSIDRLAQVMDRLIPAARTASNIGSGLWNGGQAQYAPGGNPTWANTPNGGWTSANYRTRFTPQRMMPQQRGNGGHGSSGGGASGGGAGGPAGAPGGGMGSGGAPATGMAMMIPGLRSGWEGVVNYGNAQMSGQTALDAYYHYTRQMNGGMVGNGGVRDRYLANVLGTPGTTTNNIGLNRTDILAGDILRQRTSGGYGSYNYQVAGRNMASVNAATGGTLGALQSTQVQNSLYTPQMYWRLRQMGIGGNMETGGRRVGVSRIAENILQRLYPNQQVSLGELNTSLQSGGGVAYTLDQLGLDPGTRSAMEDILRQRVTARNGGLSPDEFDTLTEQATGPDQSKATRKRARTRLQEAGVDVNTMLDAQKTIQGGQDQRDAMISGDFADSMKTAASSVDRFNEAVSKFLDDTGLDKVMGASGGTSVLNTFFSELGKLGPAALNPFGWVTAGGSTLLTSAFSQGPETPGTASSTPDKPGTSGGKTPVGKGSNLASRVLALMQSQAGDPYVWGGNGPNGWDCSGLVKWALDTAGFKMPGGVPRVAGDQIAKIPGEWINPSEARPGDLLYRSPGHGGPGEHIAMYAGGGKTIEARSKAYGVGNFPATKGRAFNKAKRIFSGPGNPKSITNNYEPEAGTENTLNKQQGLGSWAGAGNTGDSYGSSEEASLIVAALGGSPGAAPATPTNFGGTLNETPGGNSTEDLNGEKGTTPESAKKIAKSLLKTFGWGMGEWDELEKLWTKESSWNYKAKNKSSGAYGIPQSLPGSKMAKFGSDWRDNPVTQIKWGLDYIKHRYKSPTAAWAHSQKVGWYDKGAWEIQQDEFARIHQGEMVLPKKQADTIRDALIKDTFFGSTKTSTGSGSSSPSLTFHQGSVVIQVTGALNDSSARSAARAFAEELAKEDIYNRLASGVTHA